MLNKRQLARLTTSALDQTAAQRAALFSSTEHVGYKSDPYTDSYGPAPFFVINPLKSALAPRTIESVTEYRNVLIEFDKLSLSKQETLYERTLNLPFATKTYSGGSSIHYIIALGEAVDADEYRFLNTVLQRIIRLNDDNVKNPNRLARTAGVLRDNGVRQELLATGPRVSLHDLYERLVNLQPVVFWRARHEHDEQLRVDAERRANPPVWNGELNLASKWRAVLETGELPQGYERRRDVLVACGTGLAKDGVPLPVIEGQLYELQSSLGIERDDVPGIIRWISRNIA